MKLVAQSVNSNGLNACSDHCNYMVIITPLSSLNAVFAVTCIAFTPTRANKPP